jgi:large exoprotein involved in heme utilization and adhesion
VSIFDGGEIAAETSTTGNGGQVTLQTDDLLLVGNNTADIFTGITGNSLSPSAGGASGGVTVTANTLEIFGGARISADTFGSGVGGNVTVTAGSALISDSDSPFLSGISAASLSETASGHGGKITASFGDLTISGNGAITASTSGPGNAGDISVTANRVRLVDGGQIFADTNGAGNGGIVNLSAKALSVSGRNGFGSSGVFSNTNAQEGGGLGGSVIVKGQQVTLENQGAITAISSGDGKGGSITLKAKTLSLSGGSDVGASSTRPASPAGDAGSVTIDVSGPMTISSGASVATVSVSSNAGTVAITAPNLSLNNGSITVDAPSSNAGQIQLSVARQLEMTNSQLLAAAENAGGDITVDPMFFLLNDSVISANASAGRGGNILLVADFFFRSDTQITATGSQNGTVNIAAPELDLTNGLVTLPSSVIDASTQIREQCAQRLGLDFSSFLVLGRGSVDVSPDEAQTNLGAAPASHPQKRKKR